MADLYKHGDSRNNCVGDAGINIDEDITDLEMDSRATLLALPPREMFAKPTKL